MTTVAVLAVLLATTGFVVVRRRTQPKPTDIAQFLLSIPNDQWRQP